MIDLTSTFQKLEFSKILQRLSHYATSDLGRALVEQLAPSTDPLSIADELTKVSELKLLLESDDPFPIEGIRDIRSAVHRAAIEGSALPPAELYSILSTQRTARGLRTYFQKKIERYPRLSELVGALYSDKVLEYNINQTIDEEGRVKDSASKNLHELRRGMVIKSAALRKNMESILKTAASEG